MYCSDLLIALLSNLGGFLIVAHKTLSTDLD